MSAVYIAGIAASSAWDTAGESIDIHGMDISSLEGAVLNFEHNSAKSSDYVGKVLKAKKIFSEKDCSNEIELKYWNKCQIPFLFCLGVLFNEYQPAAKEIAAIFEFDANNPGLPPTLGFSIEGAKQEKANGVITHSIARKLTITAQPANKTCLADKVSMEPVATDPLAGLFKSQSLEIELFDEVTLQKSMPMPSMPKMPKQPKAGLKQPSASLGTSIGQTKTGQDVMSHQKVHSYSNFNAEDHRNASVLHNAAAAKANAGKDWKLADHHNQKSKMHDQAAGALERKANRFGNARKAVKQKAQNKVILGESEGMNKALTATGTGMVAPGQLTGGAALQGGFLGTGKKKKEPKSSMVSVTSMSSGGMAGGSMGKSEALVKTDNLNKPLVNKVPGKDMSPGWKAGMGTSHMGQKVRHGASAETVFTAKDIAHKQLKNLRKEPKPKLGKAEELEKSNEDHKFLGAQSPKEFKVGKKYGTKQMSYIGSTDTHHNFKHGDLDVKIPRKASLNKNEQWLARAQEEYKNWPEREEFEKFMKLRVPSMAKAEIEAFGRMLVLKKSISLEKSLGVMMGMNKSEESPHKPSYGQAKPHASHSEMMKLPASEHHRLESEHQEHAFAAEDKGDHENASKHKDAAAMHMNYSVAVSKPTKSPYAPKGSHQLKNDRDQKKLRTGYAEQYHKKLDKSEEDSHAKVGDEVHVHMPKEGEKIKGVVRSIHTKEMGMGGKELPKDKHSAHVELLENGKNGTRHPKGDKYFVPAKHGKKTEGDFPLHITPIKKALSAT